VIDQSFLNDGEEIISFSDNRVLTSHHRLIDLQRNQYQSNIKFHDVSMIVEPEEILLFNSYSLLTNNGRIFTWGAGNNTYRNGYAYPIEVSGEEPELQDEPAQKTQEQINAILHENETVIESIITEADYTVLTSEHRIITGGFHVMSNFQGRFGDGTLSSRTYALDITENFHLSSGETIEGLFLEGTYYLGAYSSLSRVFTWGISGAGTGKIFNDSYVSLPFDITPFFELEDGETLISFDKRLVTSANRIFEIVGPFVLYQEDYKNLPMEIATDITLQEGELFDQTIETDLITTTFGRVIYYNYNNNVDISGVTQFEEGEEIITALVQNDYLTYFFTSKNQLFQYHVLEGTWENINHLFDLEEKETLAYFFGNNANCYVLTSNHRLFSWGKDNSGSIGNGEYSDQESPVEITMYFDLADGEVIQNMIMSRFIYTMQIVTSENRTFAWGYYSPYASLNGTPRTISFWESKVVSTIEFEPGEEIIHPEIIFTDSVVDGYYNDIDRYHLFSLETMPSANLVVYLELKPKTD
jgi:hypothetical protein